jgi:hypothetical protein
MLEMLYDIYIYIYIYIYILYTSLGGKGLRTSSDSHPVYLYAAILWCLGTPDVLQTE